jgi:hypothetical protein
MKRLFVWAMVATLLTAGSAFASGRTLLHAAANATAGSGLFLGSGPTTTNNDDSCDISTAPAATLLLPYFEVDINAPQTTAQTTLFTITNVTQIPQIAHVTVWTDLSYPVLDFNIFLTGYDVQGINLYDVIARGFVASNAGTSIDDAISPTGQRSLDNTDNANFAGTVEADCSILPGPIPNNILADVRTALTTGKAPNSCGSGTVGLVHANAIGYVTIDVASTCSVKLPIDSSYYTDPADGILYDNVLIGDYQQINPNPTTGNYAGGNPLVHIRAIPEGGPAGVFVATNLPFTFYDRYTPAPTATRTWDRRQPLPSTFAARFIQGGTGAFNTNFKIWREGVTTGGTACTGTAYTANNGSAMVVRDIVRFDEHENPTINATQVRVSPVSTTTVVLPETSSTSTSSGNFPPLSTSGDVGGWMYLNLNNGGSAAYSVQRAGFSGPATSTATVRQNQNWVIVSMFAEGRFSVDFDAAWLGNGCSPAPPVTNINGGATAIGPAPNVTP